MIYVFILFYCMINFFVTIFCFFVCDSENYNFKIKLFSLYKKHIMQIHACVLFCSCVSFLMEIRHFCHHFVNELFTYSIIKILFSRSFNPKLPEYFFQIWTSFEDINTISDLENENSK